MTYQETTMAVEGHVVPLPRLAKSVLIVKTTSSI